MTEGLTDSLPLVDSGPDQLPLAVQDVEFVEDQVSVELSPSAMEVGATEMLTVGAGGGLTVSDVEPLPEPPAPLQLKL
ncbi:MAG: hypothetical protein ABR956_14340 [Terracidiphilus sp.]